MVYPNTSTTGQSFRPGMLVKPVSDLGSVQSPDGMLVPCEKLGPGIVEQVSKDGTLGVHWVGARFDAYMDAEDVCSCGDHAHLVAIYRCDNHGNKTMVRSKIVDKAGLEHNWTVELRPRNVVRAVRADGCAWTFRFKPIFRRLEASWTLPPEDDDAEAVAVAEIAV